MNTKSNVKYVVESVGVFISLLILQVVVKEYIIKTNEVLLVVIPTVIALVYLRLRLTIVKLKKESIENLNSALIDKLTGLYNRNYFDTAIKREFSSSDRSENDISIIYFDIDKFKLVNDNYGHDVGDEILSTVASIVKLNTRETDIACRWGGDEYILVLPNTNIDDANYVAEKIRFSIEDFDFSNSIKITASLGVAQRARGEYYSSLFRRVDKALYEAKENGRNQLSTSTYNIDEINVKFTWLESWNSNHPTIDAQHKNLIDITNQLSEQFSIKNELNDEVVRLSEELVEDCKKHFNYEVAVLRKEGYPHANEHEIIHNDLLERVQKVKNGFVKGNIGIRPYLNFIFNELIVNHLIEEDKKFFKHFS